jgi:hypothetical protein
VASGSTTEEDDVKIIAHGFIALFAGLSMGCRSDPTDPSDIPGNVATGALFVELGSDAPENLDPRVEEVWVRIDTVNVRHEDRGRIDVADVRQDVDLMAPTFALIGDADVWVGSYDRVEIGVADTWIVVDGVEEELSFLGDVDPLDPLAGGIIVNETFFVDEDSETTLTIAWDLDENLAPQGDGWSLGAATNAYVDIVASE